MNPKTRKILGRVTQPQFLGGLALVLLVLGLMLTISPDKQPIPGTDSSVFLYEGQQILDGAIPYRDLWDHKGPAIYYVNAIGLGLTSGSRWGVWGLEVAAVLTAALIAYQFLLKALGFWPAVFASLLFVINLQRVLDGGNLVEEFALPLQFGMLWLFWLAWKEGKPSYWMTISVLAALCFLFRPNLIGIPLATGLFLLISLGSNHAQRARTGLTFAIAGGLTVLVAVGAYFMVNGALGELWDQMFTFNFAYDSFNAPASWNAMLAGLNLLGPSAFLALAAWGLAVVALREKNGIPVGLQPVLAVSTFALPIELVFAVLSGRVYPHYYMSWLPTLTILLGFFVFYFGHLSDPRKSSQGPVSKWLGFSLLVAFVLFPGAASLGRLATNLEPIWRSRSLPQIQFAGVRQESALIFLSRNTSPQDKLLVWGNSLSLNFLSERAAPTKFAYQTALFQSGYTDETIVAELLNDLVTHPETIIIDTLPGSPHLPLNTPIEDVPEHLRPLFEYIATNYTVTETLGRTGWQVYEPAANVD